MSALSQFHDLSVGVADGLTLRVTRNIFGVDTEELSSCLGVLVRREPEGDECAPSKIKSVLSLLRSGGVEPRVRSRRGECHLTRRILDAGPASGDLPRSIVRYDPTPAVSSAAAA